MAPGSPDSALWLDRPEWLQMLACRGTAADVFVEEGRGASHNRLESPRNPGRFRPAEKHGLTSIPIPGGRRALELAELVTITYDQDQQDVQLRVPVPGAIVVKAAAAPTRRLRASTATSKTLPECWWFFASTDRQYAITEDDRCLLDGLASRLEDDADVAWYGMNDADIRECTLRLSAADARYSALKSLASFNRRSGHPCLRASSRPDSPPRARIEAFSRPGTGARRDPAATLVLDSRPSSKRPTGANPAGLSRLNRRPFTKACWELQGVLCSVPVLVVPVAVAPSEGSTGQRRG